MTLRIALAGAAGLCAHHGQIASPAGGHVHASFKKRALGSLIASFWGGAGAGEHGHATIAAEDGRGDRLVVKVCEEG